MLQTISKNRANPNRTFGCPTVLLTENQLWSQLCRANRGYIQIEQLLPARAAVPVVCTLQMVCGKLGFYLRFPILETLTPVEVYSPSCKINLGGVFKDANLCVPTGSLSPAPLWICTTASCCALTLAQHNTVCGASTCFKTCPFSSQKCRPNGSHWTTPIVHQHGHTKTLCVTWNVTPEGLAKQNP